MASPPPAAPQMADGEARLDPNAIVERVVSFSRERKLFRAGSPVVVAVSGGQDSVCLLDVLRRAAQSLSIDLRVAHLDHRFRGRQSEEDAEFVRSLAQGWNIPVQVGAVDVPAYRAKHHLSKQVAARHARLQFLARAASLWGADQVALGHTADDSAETLLLNLLRGSGLAGMGGLAATRAMQRGQLGPPVAETEWLGSPLPPLPSPLPELIRPLLPLSRAETEGYCRARGLPFRTDPSNSDPTYRRNWIRSELLPAIESRAPGATGRMAAAAGLLADDYAALNVVVDRLWSDLATVRQRRVEFTLERWGAVAAPLRRHLLRRAIEAAAGSLEEVSRAHLRAALELIEAGHAGAGIDLPGGIRIEKGYTSFVVGKAAGSPAGGELPEEGVRLPVPGAVSLPSGAITAAVLDAGGAGAHPFPAAPTEAYLDADRTGPDLIVRRRKRGDRFVPLGMSEPKKLHDFLVDRKVPRGERDRVPVVANPDSIVWVAGERIDDRFKVSEETRRILRLTYRDRGVGIEDR